MSVIAKLAAKKRYALHGDAKLRAGHKKWIQSLGASERTLRARRAGEEGGKRSFARSASKRRPLKTVDAAWVAGLWDSSTQRLCILETRHGFTPRWHVSCTPEAAARLRKLLGGGFAAQPRHASGRRVDFRFGGLAALTFLFDTVQPYVTNPATFMRRLDEYVERLNALANNRQPTADAP